MEKTPTILSEDEIVKMDWEEANALQMDLEALQKKIQEMTLALMTKAILETVDGYDIEEVSIQRDYEYNDEGFTGNCMVLINGEDTYYNYKEVPRKNGKAEKLTFNNLQSFIDDAVTSYMPTMPESSYFNIPQLRAKFFHNKLQEEVPTNDDSKIFTRYKL